MSKLALVQFTTSINKDENLRKILNYIRQASKRGASLCAFQEFMMFHSTSKQRPSQVYELSETIRGNFIQQITQYAKKYSIEVVGTFYETGKKNRVYDTAFLINSSGKLVSKYRKIHLYDALGFKESKKLMAGSSISRPAKTSLGTVGMMICYDLRFPEMSRILSSMGSHILVAPSAWVKGYMKEDHWITINKTRAIENGCFVVAPDAVGHVYCGRSLVIDPFGKILLDMKKRQGISIIHINLNRVNQVRKSLPLMKNRRKDVYSTFHA